MTYLDVHVQFLLLPTVIVALLAIPRMAEWGWRGRVAVPAMAVVAVLYTTPWDNLLVAVGVWNSPEDRILGRLAPQKQLAVLADFPDPALAVRRLEDDHRHAGT